MAAQKSDGSLYPAGELLTDNEVRSFTASDDAVAFPLGGIGTGNVFLGARGELRDWELFNHPSKGTELPYTFFAVRADQHGPDSEPLTRVLEGELNPPHCPPKTSTRGYWPMSTGGLPRLDDTTFRGTYPIAEVEFHDAALPVEIGLEAYTPFSPLDPESSGIPVAVLEYTVSNPTEETVDVSLMGSFPNVAGYLADDHRTDGGLSKVGQNRNTVRQTDSLTGIHYTTEKYDPDHLRYGEFGLAVLDASDDVFHKEAWGGGHWFGELDPVWREFEATGCLEANAYDEPSDDGEYVVGSLGTSRTLAPGAETTVTFLLSWYVPNRTASWRQPQGDEADGISECCSDSIPQSECGDGERRRNHYATRFDGAWDVATGVEAELEELRDRTYTFRDAFFDTTVPGYVLDAVSSALSVIRSPTCIWLDDGSFLGFEGCDDRQGCCGGTCTHVWNYAQSLARLFPSLEREMRRIEFEENTDEDGFMPFRTPLPLGSEPDHGDTMPAADGQMGTVMRLYREWIYSGDDAFLERLWPHARRALEFAFDYKEWDPDEDGVMTGEQHTTLDVEYYGPNTVAGSWYLGALAAGAEMARAVGDDDVADRYERVLDRGADNLNKRCWNGTHYIQALDDPDAHPYQYGAGCHINQVIGQWCATMLGLGDLLPKDRVRTALRTLFRENFLRDHTAHANTQRAFAVNDDAGLLICTWPDENMPEVPVPYYAETQCGYEYQAAAHMIYAGIVEEGLSVVKAIRDRHDGVKRNPWNEFECGSHYARSMANWSVYEALAGYEFDLTGRSEGMNERGFRFDPIVNEDSFTGFWITDEAWGTYDRIVDEDGTPRESVDVLYTAE